MFFTFVVDARLVRCMKPCRAVEVYVVYYWFLQSLALYKQNLLDEVLDEVSL